MTVAAAFRVKNCADCGVPFSPERSTARFCSSTCRSRAHRRNLVATPRAVLLERADAAYDLIRLRPLDWDAGGRLELLAAVVWPESMVLEAAV